MKTQLILVLSFLLLSACASSFRDSGRFTLENLEKSRKIELTSSHAESLFGRPYRKIDLGKEEEAWIYLDATGQYQQGSLTYSHHLGRVTVLTWMPRDQKDHTLTQVASRYPEAHFLPKEKTAQTAKESSFQVHEDRNSEILIETARQTGEVQMISFILHSPRTPAAKSTR